MVIIIITTITGSVQQQGKKIECNFVVSSLFLSCSFRLLFLIVTLKIIAEAAKTNETISTKCNYTNESNEQNLFNNLIKSQYSYGSLTILFIGLCEVLLSNEEIRWKSSAVALACKVSNSYSSRIEGDHSTWRIHTPSFSLSGASRLALGTLNNLWKRDKKRSTQ